MALNINDWNRLPIADKNKVIGFLIGNCRIDLEYPDRNSPRANSYPIAEGTTVGGHPMKYGEEYRINVYDITNIPPFLDAAIRERGTKNRIGGSDAIRAIIQYGNLIIGEN